MGSFRWSRYIGNPTSTTGIILALVSLVAVIFLAFMEVLSGHTNPYIGIFLYLAVPPFIVVGAVLIPIGMLRSWRRHQRGEQERPARWPAVDLGIPRHRRLTVTFTIATVTLLCLFSVGGYHAYHHSNSAAFCGLTCHEVMKPEYTAYQQSSHARVACAACHIGSGAGWFARSKLSGVRQVFAVAKKDYSRPIPTPIEHLRPAQETCEQCHWPEKFFGAQQVMKNHYLHDEEVTHWPINLLILTGGGDPESGQRDGIHWHMNIETKVEYISRDERRQEIPWVRVTNRETGTVTLYEDTDAPLTDEEIAAGPVRIMDCMDCHNRPSHVFRSPDYAVDLALLTERIPKDLPSVKAVAVAAMAAGYETEGDAMHGIANHIASYYRKKMGPEFAKNTSVKAAIAATQELYSNNIFPEMGADWSVYPDNIGHFTDPGCMRCHSGYLQSAEGESITQDCRACHLIMSQGSGENAEFSTAWDGLEFRHPEDIDEEWRETGCYECHDGTEP